MPQKSNEPGDRRLRGCSTAERDVYDYLLAIQQAGRKAGRAGWVRPRQATIAKAIGVCRETVSRAVKELRRRGLLMIEAKTYRNAEGEIRRAANRYYVFVARSASAVVQFLAGKGVRPLQSADCDSGITQRAERSFHRKGPIKFSEGKTAFLLAWAGKGGGDRPKGGAQR